MVLGPSLAPAAFTERAHVGDIDLRPYIAPHTLRLAPDGLIYITCENSAVVAVIDRSTHKVVDAIDSWSPNGHRLVISPDGQRLYTENEEDGTASVIDLPRRKLLGKIKTPRPLAGNLDFEFVPCSCQPGTVLCGPTFSAEVSKRAQPGDGTADQRDELAPPDVEHGSSSPRSDHQRPV
jgi:DNA-binding beta-propeller fold protein YncE